MIRQYRLNRKFSKAAFLYYIPDPQEKCNFDSIMKNPKINFNRLISGFFLSAIILILGGVVWRHGVLPGLP